ncbi:MAG: SRPBCC domain-containing protein [Myxococcales bacterium]
MSHELRIVRRFSASAEELYEAFTSPELLVQWMLPMPGCRTEARLDVRVGGTFRIEMFADGKAYPHHGQYLLLEPPRRIEFSWISEATQGQASLVSVEIRALSDQESELTLVQCALPSEATVHEHREGWTRGLDQLVGMLLRGNA